MTSPVSITTTSSQILLTPARGLVLGGIGCTAGIPAGPGWRSPRTAAGTGISLPHPVWIQARTLGRDRDPGAVRHRPDRVAVPGPASMPPVTAARTGGSCPSAGRWSRSTGEAWRTGCAGCHGPANATWQSSSEGGTLPTARPSCTRRRSRRHRGRHRLVGPAPCRRSGDRPPAIVPAPGYRPRTHRRLAPAISKEVVITPRSLSCDFAEDPDRGCEPYRLTRAVAETPNHPKDIGHGTDLPIRFPPKGRSGRPRSSDNFHASEQ